MNLPKTSEFDKISPTALLTAYARQFTDIPYTKEIAELTNVQETLNQLFTSQEQQEPTVLGLAVLVEARYIAIEQVRAKFNGRQILELASGLLPRGMVLSENPAIAFIESDLPGMIQKKQQLVRQLIGERSNLHFLAIDAVNSLSSSVLQNYFQLDEPVTVLCEGLLMYLTFAEKQQVFANVRDILQTYGGVWITPDLRTKIESERMGRNTTAFEPVNQKFSSLTGRSFSENEFKDLNHVREFVQEQGFQIEEFSMLEVIDKLKSVFTLGINLDRIKAGLSELSVFTLTLA